MVKYKLLMILCLLQVVCVYGRAQDHLKVKNIFDKYGKREGSILVQLSTDILAPKTNITLYKSLIIGCRGVVEEDIVNAIKTDIVDGIIISEAKKNGKIEYLTYYIENKISKDNEFILYKNKGDKIILVYLNGKITPKDLETELGKLKDLLIYVNNKRIKLQ